MVSMIQGEVVSSHHWLTTGQFTDIVAISQMTPGPIGINTATYVGYSSMVTAGHPQWMGIIGSFTATFAVVLPSFVMMLIISKFLMQYKDHPVVESIFMGIRPAVVGLLAAASLLLMTRENFSSPNEDSWQFGISVFLFLFAFIGQHVYHINPIRLIALCAVAGAILL